MIALPGGETMIRSFCIAAAAFAMTALLLASQSGIAIG